MLLKYYLEKLNYSNMPKFLEKYLKCPSLMRLKKVGYFCGMDYASKDVYNFSEYISKEPVVLLNNIIWEFKIN